MSCNKLHNEESAETGDALCLPGLDGTNPLGFLAALGLFRVVDETRLFGELRMSWSPSGGTYVAVLHAPAGSVLDESALVAALAGQLASDINDHPSKLLDALSQAGDQEPVRHRLLRDEANSGDRIRMDWAASLASDFASADSINQLQTARRDYFYGNLTSVIRRTTLEHLRRAIFHPWDYADALDNQSLHLDPSEDRRHAHQWNRPAGDPERKTHGGMLGANRLALEAFPLFPSFPEAGTLRTLGFTGKRSTDTRWTWPLWQVKLPLPPIRSLLGMAILQSEKIDADDIIELRAQGIAAVVRTRRILVGKTPNFTPGERIA